MSTDLNYPSLHIDCEKVAENIRSSITDIVSSNNAQGVVMGFSGGIDSSVLGALTQQALGSEKLKPYYLYDRTNQECSNDYAKLIAEQLSVDLTVDDIDQEMQKRQAYNSFIMQLMLKSKLLSNKLSAGLWGDENGFVYSLRKGDLKGNPFREFLYQKLIEPVERSFYIRQLYRRQYLEQKATEQNRIVLGAANRSEVLIGYFVKDGVDDMPNSPISFLYKTQVFQLARHLKIPDEIINRPSSPDLLKGISDLDTIGIGYREIDIILHGIECGLSDEKIMEAEVTKKQIEYVKKLKKLSDWKR